jgi:hypothetical protein
MISDSFSDGFDGVIGLRLSSLGKTSKTSTNAAFPETLAT